MTGQDLMWSQVVSQGEMVLELTAHVETSFQTQDHLINDCMMAMSTPDSLLCMTDDDDSLSKAKPLSPFVMSEKDRRETSSLLHKRIEEIEREMASGKVNPFELDQETDILHGEFEKDLEKYNDRPVLRDLLLKYQEVFGPLPSPGTGCKLAEMDLELKEEWKTAPLRGKCWPMPHDELSRSKNRLKNW
jgi:hypothetical protein